LTSLHPLRCSAVGVFARRIRSPIVFIVVVIIIIVTRIMIIIAYTICIYTRVHCVPIRFFVYSTVESSGFSRVMLYTTIIRYRRLLMYYYILIGRY